MKKMSLIKCTLISCGGLGIPCIIYGIIQLMVANGLLGKPVRTIAAVLVIASMLLFMLVILKVKSDIWDETAKEHYAEAHRITLRIVSRAVLVISVVLSALEGMQKSFALRVGHVWIFYGVMEMVLWGSFAYLEKRDA